MATSARLVGTRFFFDSTRRQARSMAIRLALGPVVGSARPLLRDLRLRPFLVALRARLLRRLTGGESAANPPGGGACVLRQLAGWQTSQWPQTAPESSVSPKCST